MLASLFVSTAIKEKLLSQRESKGLCTRVLDPHSIRPVDLDPGSGSRREKRFHKKRKKDKFHVLKVLDVLF
jgi:hypothetical protein